MLTKEEFLGKFTRYQADYDQLEKYFTYASDKHRDQVKLPNGEPYINHVIRVALLLQNHELELIIAALLHDVVEKSDTTLEEIRRLAGPKVALLVRGVTKTEEERDIITLLRDTCDQDSRVITLRLADRLDNLRYSYPHMDAARQEKYRQETPVLQQLAEEYGIDEFSEEIRAELIKT